MKMWERLIDGRIRQEVQIIHQQYGFVPGKGAMDAIFALRVIVEKYIEGQKELHSVFIIPEKAYDWVPIQELCYCMRQAGVIEDYVKIS